MATLITLTSHTPFELPPDLQTLFFPPIQILMMNKKNISKVFITQTGLLAHS
ncbi:MAG: hypothetical protein UX10_C0002G0023 [Candidatus Magasanikbacteria bacterium GW2011_GWA2_45_39]|uniref:Uncharacterized protein n=1 Tax=Candidatus Magasanikbacteria bacterium GW2011_GWA2_45_39 TaxID=1619041 RepID=A0A0G1MIW9_9BACT|nr:MAG: hypothetical protein UX10_C0002G0023 [Candidatus Magasanikbacteria bacterium GW2011_GWA2_45_39]